MSASILPPGQFELDQFPRFGLGKFARRFPDNPETIRFEIRGDVGQELLVEEQWFGLPRHDQRSDFHCVTSWSVRDQHWTGVRFSDFHESIVLPRAKPRANADLVVLRAADGFIARLPLEDMLADDVLLADRLNGESLGIKHGAPLRLIAPAHYGYKNVKHLTAVEFWTNDRHYRFPRPYPKLMDHPRARVALQERTRWLPGWLVRPFYRMLIPSTIRNFDRAMASARKRDL